MTAPPRPLTLVRSAVREALVDLGRDRPGAVVLVAASGGADSLALAAATGHVAPRLGLRAGLVTVDHGLQAGARDQAHRLAQWARDEGFEPVEILPVTVAGPGGPEAAARTARYAALEDAARRHDAAVVLLGHTLDDQAETVLLGLVRGSGARSASGMPATRGRYVRPLLGIDRATTRAACVAAGLVPWRDPHNDDPAYLRVRVRGVLPRMEAALGEGVVGGLARTASLLRADADALDALADDAWSRVSDSDGSLDAAGLGELLQAVRTRVLRSAAIAAGAPAGSLSLVHVSAMDDLVGRWRGQGPVSLPGGVECRRRSGRLVLARRGGGSRPVTGPTRDSATDEHVGSMPMSPAESQPSPPAAVSPPRKDEPDVDPAAWYADDIEQVLVSRQQIEARIAELAEEVRRDYGDQELTLVAVLKGAVMFVADLARALHQPVEVEFMAVSSYGHATSSSGVVRILKDLDTGLEGRHVLLVEDIVDSGLTLSWLLKNLASRNPASLSVIALLRKPDAARVAVDVRYVGFEIPNEFVVGYGLDFGQRYRSLPFVGTLRPSVYQS